MAFILSRGERGMKTVGISTSKKNWIIHSVAFEDFHRIINYFMPAIYHNFVSHRVNALFSGVLFFFIEENRDSSVCGARVIIIELWRVAAPFRYGKLIITLRWPDLLKSVWACPVKSLESWKIDAITLFECWRCGNNMWGDFGLRRRLTMLSNWCRLID